MNTSTKPYPHTIPATVVSLPLTPPATFISHWQSEFLQFAGDAIIDAAENLLYDNFLLCENLEPEQVQTIIAKWLIDQLIRMTEDLDYTIRVDDQFTEDLRKVVEDHNPACNPSTYNTASILGAH
jgi:hypothetical protein